VRLHPSTKSTTFGNIFTSLAVMTYSLEQLYATGEGKYVGLTTHTFLAMLSVMLTVPVGAHAIARAAHRGVLPAPAVVDKLKEVEEGG